MSRNTFNCSVPPFAKELIAPASLSCRYPSKDRNNEETHVLVATFWTTQEGNQRCGNQQCGNQRCGQGWNHCYAWLLESVRNGLVIMLTFQHESGRPVVNPLPLHVSPPTKFCSYDTVLSFCQYVSQGLSLFFLGGFKCHLQQCKSQGNT